MFEKIDSATSRAAPRARCLPALTLAILCATSLGACDRDDGKSAEKPGEQAENEAPTKPSDAEGAGQADPANQKLFDPEDKSLAKRACEFLTADRVADQFGVPADEFKQVKVMGCIYSHKQDDVLTEASLTLIQVHDTPERASEVLANVTATKSKQEVEAGIDVVKGEVQDQPELDTEAKKQVAGELTDLAKLGLSDQGQSYDDLSGVGDEARISNSDGLVWVRLGNLTFQIQAYQGPNKPQLEFDPKTAAKDVKKLQEQAMEIQKKWIADTVDQRKAAAAKLAPVVVEAIAKG